MGRHKISDCNQKADKHLLWRVYLNSWYWYFNELNTTRKMLHRVQMHCLLIGIKNPRHNAEFEILICYSYTPSARISFSSSKYQGPLMWPTLNHHYLGIPLFKHNSEILCLLLQFTFSALWEQLHLLTAESQAQGTLFNALSILSKEHQSLYSGQTSLRKPLVKWKGTKKPHVSSQLHRHKTGVSFVH